MFKFRLQRVLELRAEAEQAKARALAEAHTAAESARATLDTLASLHQSSRAQVHAAHTQEPRVGHLHQLSVVLQSIEARIETAADVVETTERVVAGAQNELELAARDRRVLDRLKERHADAWRATEAHKDRLLMDEIALARFARNRDAQQNATSSTAGDGPGSPDAHQNDGTNQCRHSSVPP
jgi:flagellar FliJ protein